MIDDEIMAQPVKIAGRDAGADMGSDKVECLGGKHAGPPHAFEGIRPVDLDPAVPRLRRRQAHHHILLHAERVQTVFRGRIAAHRRQD